MLGNGARNDGGLWARLPAGVYVPFLGLDFGASTNPIRPTDDPNAPNVILISKQYDGASDCAQVCADEPARRSERHHGLHVRAQRLLPRRRHGSRQRRRRRSGRCGPWQRPTRSKYIVTRNGNVTDIVIKNQPGDLPLTQPLKAMGVPVEFVKAIDPLLAGHDRSRLRATPNGGVYPSEPVHFKIFPKPGKLFQDFLAIAGGSEQTGENLDDLD